MYALVLIEHSVKSLDKTFVYKIPQALNSFLKKGMKVKIPFGKQILNGFVLEISERLEEQYDVKEIIEVVDPEIVLNEEMLNVAEYLQKETLCTKISAFQTMLPASLKIKEQKHNYNSFIKEISLNKPKEEIVKLLNNRKFGKNQKEILEELLIKKGVLKKDFLLSSVKSLINEGLIKEELKQTYRINIEEVECIEKKLTEEQSIAYGKIKLGLNSYNTYLLHGVTGSGKTEIYIKLIVDVLNNGKTALLLIPEISLTAQITKRIYARFGNKVAILHSALSLGEKHDEYLKIIRGEVSLVVGTRSAVFAPLENLGLIIIDEEHSQSYKQDNTPRYNAKDIAEFRCRYNNVPLVLGSATPLLESKARADKKVFELVELNSRVGASVLPEVHIVNMEDEMKKRNTIFSSLLAEKIQDRLNKGEQIVLLLNRRGYSTFINCSNCGFVYKCPSCDISLTYHKSSNNLICHYCGYLVKKDLKCPECHEEGLNFYGLGTEKLEEYINNNFKGAKVVRMDQDTTTKKGSHEKIIQAFLDEEYNILLGTQMVSKGLDFPKVSLVGVINADTSLNIPDFRSSENTFSLLSQVAGRAGRGDILGEVIIQTFNPDNFVIECVRENNYQKFYNQEMMIRRRLKYPPYYYLVSLKVIGKDYNETLSEAKKAKEYLKLNLNNETLILGPTTAAVLKFKNEYRFQIMIKYRFDENLKKVLRDLDEQYIYNKDVYIEIDFNPSKI